MEEANKIQDLQKQFNEAVAASEFLDSAAGKLWVDLASQEISHIVRDITSDKYIKDHNGYIYALAELRANEKMLRKFRAAASAERRNKIQDRLDVLNGRK